MSAMLLRIVYVIIRRTNVLNVLLNMLFISKKTRRAGDMTSTLHINVSFKN